LTSTLNIDATLVFDLVDQVIFVSIAMLMPRAYEAC
jgi:hypothetical protein